MFGHLDKSWRPEQTTSCPSRKGSLSGIQSGPEPLCTIRETVVPRAGAMEYFERRMPSSRVEILSVVRHACTSPAKYHRTCSRHRPTIICRISSVEMCVPHALIERAMLFDDIIPLLSSFPFPFPDSNLFEGMSLNRIISRSQKWSLGGLARSACLRQ